MGRKLSIKGALLCAALVAINARGAVALHGPEIPGRHEVEPGAIGENAFVAVGSRLAASGVSEIVVTVTNESADGTINRRFTSVYGLDNRGNWHRTSETDSQADGIADLRIVSTGTDDKQGNPLHSSADIDNGADGPSNLDFSETSVWSYDQRGRLVQRIDENDLGAHGGDGIVDNRITLSLTYDPHGDLTLSVEDRDFGADDVIDQRFTKTFENDARGNAVREVDAFDNGANGTIEGLRTFTSAYDIHNRLVMQVQEDVDRTTSTFAYDEHGNVVQRVDEVDGQADGTIEGRTTVTSTYNRRGDLVLEVTESGSAEGPVGTRSTFTSTYDVRGNLEQQLREVDDGADGTVDRRIRTLYAYPGSPRRSR